jgi:sec-independent protein translocase protein TatB
VGNLGMAEVLVVVVVALIVFGPERLPELARNAAKLVARFRAEATKSVEELKRAADLQGLDEDLRSIQHEVRQLRASVTDAVTGTPSTTTPPGRSKERPPPTDPEAT